MATQQNQKQGSSRKCGRNKRKKLRKGSAMSQYVRGKITFAQHASQTAFSKQ